MELAKRRDEIMRLTIDWFDFQIMFSIIILVLYLFVIGFVML
ncbi:MAG: hypothetical protein Kow0099_03750 [Candidatus Abyssubacteria bacterium]